MEEAACLEAQRARGEVGKHTEEGVVKGRRGLGLEKLH